MASWLDSLRSGAWLTRERTRLVAMAVLAAGGGGLIYVAATAQGTNFSSFYAAGTLALQGHALAVYDTDQHHARQQALFGPATLLVGQAASLAGYLAAMRALFRSAVPTADRLWLLLGAARAILAATLTVALLAMVTTFAFGIDIWPAFLASSHTARTALLESGDVG
jgi:hypothetical protein